MHSVVHDALAFCRHEYDRCAYSVRVTKDLRAVLSRRLTLLMLQRSKNIRVRKQLAQDREKLVQQRRILTHGRTARYIV